MKSFSWFWQLHFLLTKAFEWDRSSFHDFWTYGGEREIKRERERERERERGREGERKRETEPVVKYFIGDYGSRVAQRLRGLWRTPSAYSWSRNNLLHFLKNLDKNTLYQTIKVLGIQNLKQMEQVEVLWPFIVRQAVAEAPSLVNPTHWFAWMRWVGCYCRQTTVQRKRNSRKNVPLFAGKKKIATNANPIVPKTKIGICRTVIGLS